MLAAPSADVISQFLLRHTRRERLEVEENIFTAGYVNSLFALQLVMFVEKSFNISVEDQDLDIANFCSIGAIQRFVTYKLSSASAALA